MANKVIPKITAPGSAKMPTTGPHNPNVGRRGVGGQLAKVKGVGSSPSGASGPAGSFMPVQNNAMANLTGAKIGQPNPNTAAAATKKPNRKGGAAFYGES